MKYTIRFSNRFIEVKKFQVIDDKLYVLFNNKLSVVKKANVDLVDFHSETLFRVNDMLFSDDNFYYNTKTEKINVINQLNNYYYTGINFESKLVFTNQDLIIYSLNEGIIIKKISFFKDCSLSLLLDDKFIVRGNDFYSLYNLKSLDIIWQRSFSELLKGQKITHFGNKIIYKNKFFIYLSDNKDPNNLATVSIDIDTGKILNVYQGFAGNLMLSNNRLYVASYEMVKILNLTDNEILEIDFTDSLKPLGLKIHWNSSVVEGDYLYFIDGHSYKSNKLGVLDLRSRKLVWNTELKIDDGINNNIVEIKVLDDKLYIHCSDNTLHIFEINIGFGIENGSF